MITRRIVLANSLGVVASSLLPKNLIAKEKNEHRLVAAPSKANLLENENVTTDVWAYDGKVPGPTIRVKKNEEILIEFVNQLEQPTSVHWHGIRIDNAMDGVHT